MSEDFRIILTDETARAAGGGGSVAGKSIGATELSGKIGAAVQIAQEIGSIIGDAIGGILQPIRTTLVAIGKMFAEFIRPVADMVMMGLMPVLQILRPVLQLFKTFMAPAMAAAREFANISQSLSMGGDTAGAMSASIKGVQALLGPFIVSFTSVALQLANTLFTANIVNLITAISDIARMVTLAIAPDAFSDTINGMFDTFNKMVSDRGREWETVSNGLITTATQSLLLKMSEETEKTLEDYRKKVSPTMTSAYLTDPLGLMNSFSVSLDEKIPTIVSKWDAMLDKLSSSLDKKSKSKAKEIAGDGGYTDIRGATGYAPPPVRYGNITLNASKPKTSFGGAGYTGTW